MHRPFQILAMFYWYFWGYKTFTGPRANVAVASIKSSETELVDEKGQ